MAFGQRPCTVPTATFTPTVSHATCFNPKGSITFATTVSSGSAYMQSLVLKNAAGTTVYTHSPSQSLSGSISNLDVGMYTFTGTVVIEYLCNGLGYMTTVSINMQVWVGIQTVWKDLIEMTASPNSYSAKKNMSSITMAGAGSSNGVSTGNYWIEMKAQFGSASNTSVFWLIGEYDPTASFSASSNVQYIEFFKTTGTSGGIRIKRQDTGGTYSVYTLPSAAYSDKITLIRTGTTLSLRRNNALVIPPFGNPHFPVASSGAANIVVRTSSIDNGCLNVVSSMPCRQTIDHVSHAELKKRLDGGHTFAIEGGLKFTFDGEYEVSSNVPLDYSVYDKDRVVKGGYDSQGTLVAGPVLNYEYDDNRYTLDVSGMGLIQDQFYILETTDSKGNTYYLKFIYKD